MSTITQPMNGRSTAAGLRLTVRGRRVLASLLLAPIGLGIGIGLAQIPAAFAGDSSIAAGETVEYEWRTVLGGESLWSISEEIAGNRDIRDVVHEIMRLNNLSTASVQAGQRIALPNF
ncbi:LysM peptidoglycan-binding domain-containing protein [Gulosibacter macacae]|uniref:LysM peptidoglycan-binding domain-containing protein n=1 Tax=Gulosibacter macacae TaxID=2488791 RepID=A0A3P3VZM3_9MICO|nr:LysM peptidoglycan-binding domain-containing protein [Gulosibacter macacae]RRJ87954.1 LysM peptidoglycan-binding domain-containing protein [Gulosibacter macacae]